MEFRIGKYTLELTKNSAVVKNTETGHEYSVPLLNGYEPARDFLWTGPSEDELCSAFDISP